MYEQTVAPAPRPWYRQAWPWFLIALPASAVLGGIATIILAVQSPNAMVVDDYYKEGLAINRQIHRQDVARTLMLTGLLRSDGRQLSLELTSPSPLDDERVTLQFIHATRARLDREVVMQRRSDGRYYAALPELAPGAWNLRLQGHDGRWEISGRLASGGSFQTHLDNGH
ncbi:MAG TPA: hypothetical protein ENK49_00540 [Gammaproteobacteria bacterium]|nr:hypothetical protein [Gammaproteobacteria bacterium]